MTFEEDLQQLINRHSMENDSNTPDFILARYLWRCLYAYNLTVADRDRWYGMKVSPREINLGPTERDAMEKERKK